jgi:hypothetical protein
LEEERKRLEDMTDLYGLQSCVTDDDLLRERSLDESMDLFLDRVVLDGLSKINESRSSSLSEGRLRTDEVDKIGNGRESWEGRVRDWSTRQDR